MEAARDENRSVLSNRDDVAGLDSARQKEVTGLGSSKRMERNREVGVETTWKRSDSSSRIETTCQDLSSETNGPARICRSDMT